MARRPASRGDRTRLTSPPARGGPRTAPSLAASPARGAASDRRANGIGPEREGPSASGGIGGIRRHPTPVPTAPHQCPTLAARSPPASQRNEFGAHRVRDEAFRATRRGDSPLRGMRLRSRPCCTDDRARFRPLSRASDSPHPGVIAPRGGARPSSGIPYRTHVPSPRRRLPRRWTSRENRWEDVGFCGRVWHVLSGRDRASGARSKTGKVLRGDWR